MFSLVVRVRETGHTLTASTSSLTGSCSWAHGFLKCWSDSTRELTIKPCKSRNRISIQRNINSYILQEEAKLDSVQPSSPPAKCSCALHPVENLSVKTMVSFWINKNLSCNALHHKSNPFWCFKCYEFCYSSASLQPPDNTIKPEGYNVWSNLLSNWFWKLNNIWSQNYINSPLQHQGIRIYDQLSYPQPISELQLVRQGPQMLFPGIR